MIDPYPASGMAAFLWQVMLHSAIAGTAFYVWATLVGLGSGQTKRFALGAILALPLLTAAIPGRTGSEFRADSAWIDSLRILAIPLPAGARMIHAVLVVAVLTVLLTVWQELLPALRRPRLPAGDRDSPLRTFARSLPGWGRCEVVVVPEKHVTLATAERAGDPRLIVSEGALAGLSPDELRVAVRHENAHWHSGRWLRSHVLFFIRLLQCHNPVALWAFREYCVELEIACDRDAVAGRDPKLLARSLMAVYDSTGPGDLAERAAIRKRVDSLLSRGPARDEIPLGTVVAATGILAVLLPWVV